MARIEIDKKNKVVRRYHDAPQGGKGRGVLRKGAILRRPYSEREFPGPGDVRYSFNPEGKGKLYRLHDGAQDPEGRYGFTQEEMTAYFEDLRGRIQRRTENYNEERARQEADFINKDQEDVDEMQAKLLDAQREAMRNSPGGVVGQIPIMLQDDKSVVSRVFDLLSRPLFGMGESIRGRLEEDKKNDEFNPLLSPLKGILEGGIASSPLAGVLDLKEDLDILKGREKGPASRVADGQPSLPESPKYNPRREFAEGFSGREKTDTGRILREHYPEIYGDNDNNGTPNFGGFAASLAGDIILDPLTFLPGQQIARALKPAKDLASIPGAVARTTAKIPNPPAINRKVTPDYFDNLVDVNRPINERLDSVEQLTQSVVRPIARRKADEGFREGIDRLASRGVIPQDEIERLVTTRGTKDFTRAVADVTRESKAKVRHVNFEDVTGKPKVTVGTKVPQRAAQGARAGARRVAELSLLRARTSRKLADPKLDDAARASLKTRSDELSAAVDSDLMSLTKLPASEADRVVKTQIAARSNASRAITNFTHLLEGRKLNPGHKPHQFVMNMRNARDDESWLNAVTGWLTAKPLKEDIRRIVEEYTAQVGTRPVRRSGDDAAEFERVSDTWHIGLFKAIEDTMEDAALEGISNTVLRNADAPALERLAALNVADAAKAEATPSELARLTSWKEAFPRFRAPRHEEIVRLARTIGDEAKTLEDSIKSQLYELVAMSDRLPLPKNLRVRITEDGKVLTNLNDEWDDFLRQRTEIQIPKLSESSYNNAAAKIFDPSYSLHADMNETRLRFLGNSNANVAFRAGELRQSLGRYSHRSRVQSLRNLREFGTLDDRGMMQRFTQDIGRILEPYQKQDLFQIPFGEGGKPNLGDLNRWLPERYKLPIVRGGRDSAREYSDDFLENLPENADPLDALWQLTIANEKVIAEKVMLKSIADTFGIPNTSSVAAKALRNQGYEVSDVFGEQVLFHPDIVRQIDKVRELVHRPETFSAIVKAIDFTQNAWKRIVTVYNPGFHIRNVVGDTFTNAIEGVHGARGVASYRQAMRAMWHRGKLADKNMEAIFTPGTMDFNVDGSVLETLFKTRDGSSISVERALGEYNRYGLDSSQVSTNLGLAERNPTAGRVRRVTLGAAEELAENQAFMFRFALFIDMAKRSKLKNLDEVFQEAANTVRRSKFDYNDFTQTERAIFSRVLPFYKFQRKNMPYMAAMLFADPGKAMIPQKFLENFSEFQGFNEDDKGMPHADEVIPEWVRDRNMWPIADSELGTIYADPDYQFNAFLRDFGNGSPSEILAGMVGAQVGPFVQYPVEMATGTSLFNNEYTPDNSSLIDRIMGDIPQLRTYDQLKDGQVEPGRAGQIAGLGTYTNTPSRQMADLMRMRDEFYRTPEGGAVEQRIKAEQGDNRRNAIDVTNSIARNRDRLDSLLEQLRNE